MRACKPAPCAGLRVTGMSRRGRMRVGVIGQPRPTVKRVGDGALHTVDRKIAHVLVASLQRLVPQPGTRGRATLVQDALPRIGPERVDIERKVLRQVERGGQYAAI